jgi:hypothetical protein
MSFIGFMISIVIFTMVSATRVIAKSAIRQFNNYIQKVAQSPRANRYNNIAAA